MTTQCYSLFSATHYSVLLTTQCYSLLSATHYSVLLTTQCYSLLSAPNYSVLLTTQYSSTSLVRGFWDEIFCPLKPRTTKEPGTKEGYIKVDIGTKFLLQQVIWWS